MKLNFRRLDLQLRHPWTIARGRAATKTQVVIAELTGADGTVGTGEAPSASRYRESAATVESFFQKVDARGLSFNDIEGSMAYLDTLSEHDMSAKCALNVALLDGAGKKARQPVCDLLGLGFSEGKHTTSFSIGLDTPATVRTKVLEADAYPILKLKLGSPDDRMLLKALREAAPEKPVRVDANEGWKSKEHALEMLEWLAADINLQYVEQPLPAATHARDWAWLKQRSPLPIFADESYHLARDASQASECFHGVNVKLVKTGGVSGALEALQAACKAGLKTMLGCMIETSVLITAAAHLAELCDYIDLDGNLLITNDPYTGVTAERGILSFAPNRQKFGMRVAPQGDG